MLFGALPRAKNRALDRFFNALLRAQNRDFCCCPSCQKSCFLVLSFVPQIVLFGAFPRAKYRALDRAFWCSPSCQKSCSRSCSLLQLLGLSQPISFYLAAGQVIYCKTDCATLRMVGAVKRTMPPRNTTCICIWVSV